MGAELTLSNPTAYAGGVESSSRFLGVNSKSNLVLRYAFKTPSAAIVKTLTFKSKVAWLSSVGISATTKYPMRLKITRDATSHINAGSETSDYDAEMTLIADLAQGANVYNDVSATISGLSLAPDATYYLYIFPGSSSAHMFYCYDASGADLSSLICDEMLQGLVCIDDGADFGGYQPDVDTGSEWIQVVPMIDDGASWAVLG